MKKDGKERFVTVNARSRRLRMQPVRDESGKVCGLFERYEMNLQLLK